MGYFCLDTTQNLQKILSYDFYLNSVKKGFLENNFLKSKRELYKRAIIKKKLEVKFSNNIKDNIVTQSNLIGSVGVYFQPTV